MEKDFKRWHSIKELLHRKEREVYFKEREIWWCSLGVNVGFEQDGKNYQFERPVLVLKKFSKDLFWALPMTSQDKVGQYYYQFERDGRKYAVVLSQLRAMSAKRLLRKLGKGKFLADDFREVKRRIKEMI